MTAVAARRVVGLSALAVVAAVLAGGCGLLGADPVIWDLRSPTRPSDLEPGRTSGVVSDSGAARYTVLLPSATMEGEFRQVTATAPVTAGDDADGFIDTVDLAFEFADEPDEVLAHLATVKSLFDVSGDDLVALDAYIADFESKVAANGGELDVAAFEPGTSGLRTSALGVYGDDQMTVVLLIGTVDDAFSMTLTVSFGSDPK